MVKLSSVLIIVEGVLVLMLDFLSGIMDFITMLGSTLIMLIKSTLDFFLMIPSFLAYLTTSVAVLPSFIVPFVVAGIFLSVILLIVGRGSQ